MVSELLSKLMEIRIIILLSFQGQFLDDKIDGKGMFVRANGDKYEGEWKDDKIEGKGIS